jgi:hypothetical protein
MNTRSLELRAALALARRLERRDRGDEAVDILRPRLQAMPEGHGEPDYRSAANLIAAIESNRAAGVVR